MSNTHRIITGFGLIALLAGACSSTSSQADARDRATTQSCSWYQMCGQIGAGKTYDTLDSCTIQVRAKWDNAWPSASCDGKINESQLQICLAAIYATDCTSLLDIASTLAVKCAEAKVCSGASGPDGGP
ncbi:MAG TPA: DUF6184 family natural product biosynthesis lipoprotein [Polyangia bacterium]|jgi:hypothetical protein|nr:DUF6184 family natural product biosynthesis lipoprotein [Polyangia bacterium]